MSLETPTDTNSSFTSEDLNEFVFYQIEDEPSRTPTPLPTVDSNDAEFIGSLASRMPPITLTPPPDSPRRPETSNSSIFSFVTDSVGKSSFVEFPRLPTFIVPENARFFESLSSSDSNLYGEFGKWMDECKPIGGSFEAVAAMNPKETRSEPDLPSLFKRRDHGCGYCRSIGYPRWETHTRQRCAQLKALAPCKICGASGEMNHTETYCPKKPPVSLPLTQRYLASSESETFNRCREHFYKHSEWIRRIYPTSDIFF